MSEPKVEKFLTKSSADTSEGSSASLPLGGCSPAMIVGGCSPAMIAGGCSPAFGSESPAPVRNPSPPREILGLSDNIGGTAFSKHWLFRTLMNLLKVIEQPVDNAATTSESVSNTDANGDCVKGSSLDESNSTQLNDSSKSVKEAAKDSPAKHRQLAGAQLDSIPTADSDIINISDTLQDELCQLWDMSSDENVAKLLQEFKAVDILIEVISKSNAPRATEIAIGILGNMACTASVCESMASSQFLVVLSLSLLGKTDAPTLVEATRFLTTVLSNEKCRDVWLKEYASDTKYIEDIKFILRSSVNKDLLTNTASLLDYILDVSDELCRTWSSVTLLTAVVEALKQLGLVVEEGTFSLLHCLQMMSTQTNGVAAIIDEVESTVDILKEFLLKICEDEIVNLEDRRAGVVASAVSVLNSALTSSPAGYSLLFSDKKCIRCLLKILYACDKEGLARHTPASSPHRSLSSDNLITTLKEVLFLIVADIISIGYKEETELSQIDSAEDSISERTTPSWLQYMNNDCEKTRLKSLTAGIVKHCSVEILKFIRTLSEKYELTRLQLVIKDTYDNIPHTDSNSSSDSDNANKFC